MPIRSIFEANKFYYIHNKSDYNIRKTSKDYEIFIKYRIRNLVIYPNIQLLAYSFLPNHFEIIINNLQQNYDISKCLKNIQISYVMYYRNKYGYDEIPKGQGIFPQRFIAKKIITEKELKEKIQKVMLGAVTKKIVKDITKRPYTSIHQQGNTKHQNKNHSQIKIYKIIS